MPARRTPTARVASLPAVPEDRVESLSQELKRCWGTYMYCEAADFQSGQERQTSREMSRRMGEIRKELAALRGDSVLNAENGEAYREALLEQHPLAGLGTDVLRRVAQDGHVSAGMGNIDSPVEQLQGAVRHQQVTQEQIAELAADSGGPLSPATEEDRQEARAEAAQIVVSCFSAGESFFYNSMGELLQAAEQQDRRQSLLPLVRDLMEQGRLELTPADLNQVRRCVYGPGELGRLADRFQNDESPDRWGNRRRNFLQGVAFLLDREGLEIAPDERSQALAVVYRVLEQEGDEVGLFQAGADPRRQRGYVEQLKAWETRGLDVASLTRRLTGEAPPTAGIERDGDWLVVDHVRLKVRRD